MPCKDDPWRKEVMLRVIFTSSRVRSVNGGVYQAWILTGSFLCFRFSRNKTASRIMRLDQKVFLIFARGSVFQGKSTSDRTVDTPTNSYLYIIFPTASCQIGSNRNHSLLGVHLFVHLTQITKHSCDFWLVRWVQGIIFFSYGFSSVIKKDKHNGLFASTQYFTQ